MTAIQIAQETPLWLLLALQIAMGGFDVIVHHEITERLAWKPNAAQELRLHSARNALYALLFGGLAWLRPTGLLAAALMAVLLIEIVITLWDFVEEDQTRKLPPTERVLHTLMAINYGAICAYTLPLLAAWAFEPTALAWINYGIGSLVLSIAGIGCLGFALRDIYTSRRAARLAERSPPRVDVLFPGRKRVLITGATGFIGARLTASLIASGHEVIALVRSPARAGTLTAPVMLVTSLRQIPADMPVDAVVHLAGEPVANWIWTRRRRYKIARSRLAIARDIEAFIAQRPQSLRPATVVTASAIGFYGDRGEESLSEADGPGKCFAARSCVAVERRATGIRSLGVRTVSLRIGLVLSVWGGPLARMVPPFDLGLGGRMGTGRQWMSWIGRDDLVRLIAHVLACRDLDGAVNATAPSPIRNAEFAMALAKALHRPAIIPVPDALLRYGLGEMGTSLLLSSARVMPVKILASGFTFETPALETLLQAEFGSIVPDHNPVPDPALVATSSLYRPYAHGPKSV